MLNLFNRKKFLILSLAFISVVSVFVYISRYSQRGKASQPNIDISITPTSGNFSVGEEKSIDFLLQPAGTGNKISGIDIYFNAQGNAEISSVSTPTGFPGNDTSIFTEVIRDVKPQRAHISYIVIKSEDQLPTTVKVQVKFKGIRSGSGSIGVDNANTMIVGNIVGNTYNLGTIDQGSFTFLGLGDTTPTSTPTPIGMTVTPSATPSATLTPTPASCLTLPQTDNFTGATISAQMWDIKSTGGGINQSNGQLTTSLPGGSPNTVNIVTKHKVCGDFDVNFEINGFTSSQKNKAVAFLQVNEATGSSLAYLRMVQDGNKQGVESSAWDEIFVPSTATRMRLRFRRQGTNFSTYFDDGNGWRKITSYVSGFNTPVYLLFGVSSWAPEHPAVTANFDNFNLTAAIADPSGTPVPSGTPIPTASPSPTPPSGREKYIIDVGEKQSLVINIGPSINPQIKFKAKLASLRAYPELYLKLRVKDELAFLDNQNNSVVSADTCNNPTLPDRDYLVPMKATGDVYSPVQQISQPAPAGAQVAYVDGNGWIILDGMVPGRFYTLYLKGPKTRKSRMVEHFLLQPNQVSTQDFDWSGKLLDPGDLPDPANGNKQDCTINSADWSLEKTRIGATDGDNLAVCDVNYDGICNAGDSVAILDTLSKRPDDDQ